MIIKNKTRKIWLGSLAIGLAGITSAHAALGININAIDFDDESAAGDDSTIRKDVLNGKVTNIRSSGPDNSDYFIFDNIDYHGATKITVRASNGTPNVSTLKVRLATHYAYTIASIDIPPTGGSNSFQDFTVEIDQISIGIVGSGQSIFFVAEDSATGDTGYLCDVKSFRLDDNSKSVGTDINAVDFDAESKPADQNIIRNMGNKVGYMRAAAPGDIEYLAYNNFNVGAGATHFKVRASSGTAGGKLYVRLATHYEGLNNTIAVVDIPNTGGWNNFQDFTVAINQSALAQYSNWDTVFLSFEGNDSTNYQFDVKKFRFDNVVHGVGSSIRAVDFDAESSPNNESIIRKMGTKVGYLKAGDPQAGSQYSYFLYNNFNFGTGATTLTVRASSGAAQGGTLFVRLAAHYPSVNNTIATVQIPNTGGWNQFQDFTVQLDQNALLTHAFGANAPTLFFTLEQNNSNANYVFDIESFQFNN